MQHDPITALRHILPLAAHRASELRVIARATLSYAHADAAIDAAIDAADDASAAIIEALTIVNESTTIDPAK